MSVVWVKPIRSRQFSADDQRQMKAQRVFLVKCDSRDDGPDVALAACPGRGTAYSDEFPGVLANNLDAKEREEAPKDGTYYECTVDYSTRTTEQDQQEDNPLDRPPVLRLSFDSFEEQAILAYDDVPLAADADGNEITIPASGTGRWLWGKTICNSVGKPFDPSITRVYRDPVVEITINLEELPWGVQADYIDTINSDDFYFLHRGRRYQVKKHQAWLAEINTDPRSENGVEFEECRFLFKMRKDTWLKKMLDQGLVELDAGDLPPKPIRDKDGEPIQQPAGLDGKGQRLGDGAKPVFLRRRINDEKPFARLPLRR